MRRAVRLAAIVALAGILALAACRSEVVVRVETGVYADGGIDRRLVVTGLTPEREPPRDETWLADTAGVRLADPEAWARVTRGPGSLIAEGFFADAADAPALLAYRIGGTERRAPSALTVEVERRGVLDRWRLRESHADPFGHEETEAALDAATELLARVLRRELTDWLGPDVDPQPAIDVVRGPARDLAAALFHAGRAAGDEAARQSAWREVLGAHGVTTEPSGGPPFDDVNRWLRARVAAALELQPADLGFWPADSDDGERLEALVARNFGDDQGLLGEVEPLYDALTGYFLSDGAPRFRFEVRVRMPGTLLRTNGAPDGTAAIWLFRNAELADSQPFLVHATSVQARRESLVALGARRDLDLEDLLRLEDLLWRRDPSGELGRLLDLAIEKGRLDLLHDGLAETTSETVLSLATELAELLDPAGP